MPKKRTYNFKRLQGASSQQAGTSSQDGQANSSSPSVNDRLAELRKLESSKAAQKKRELAESVNQRSVPPQVGGILGLPETAPPKPKRGGGLRLRLERVRTPGPAPPKSWLKGLSAPRSLAAVGAGSVSAESGRRAGGSRAASTDFDRDRPKTLLRFATLCGLDDGLEASRKPPRLQHLVCKSIAESWDSLEPEDYPILLAVPLRLRLRILSYIDFYGPALDTAGFQALLQGPEEIKVLDLSTLVGYRGLSLKNIGRIIEKEQKQAPTAQEVEPVVESWDEDNAAISSALDHPFLQTGSRFAHLTHLSLARPSPLNTSWRDLLALSKHTPQLTHLSLAYWPRPTLTPNLASTTFASQRSHAEINAGGSHFYSVLDEDFSEPMLLIRQLSGHLLCLEWFDLEGCTDWTFVLLKLAQEQDVPVPVAAENEWGSSAAQSSQSIFLTNWARLTYLNCSQGWIPSPVGMRALNVDLGRWERYGSLSEIPIEDPPRITVEAEKKKAERWLYVVRRLEDTASSINALRRRVGYPTLTLENDRL